MQKCLHVRTLHAVHWLTPGFQAALCMFDKQTIYLHLDFCRGSFLGGFPRHVTEEENAALWNRFWCQLIFFFLRQQMVAVCPKGTMSPCHVTIFMKASLKGWDKHVWASLSDVKSTLCMEGFGSELVSVSEPDVRSRKWLMNIGKTSDVQAIRECSQTDALAILIMHLHCAELDQTTHAHTLFVF